jgi:hypothetical protein
MEEEALGCGDDYMDEIPFDELFDDDFNFGSTMAMGEEEHNNNDFLHQQVSNTSMPIVTQLPSCMLSFL